jgi:hypothetical protein
MQIETIVVLVRGSDVQVTVPAGAPFVPFTDTNGC